jgi:hypothetical protein
MISVDIPTWSIQSFQIIKDDIRPKTKFSKIMLVMKYKNWARCFFNLKHSDLSDLSKFLIEYLSCKK